MVRYVQGKPLKDLHKAWRTVAQAHYIKITRKFRIMLLLLLL